MSEVSDLGFVVSDGVLSEPYSIIRSTGSFQKGGWVTSETTIPGYGVVSVATAEDLEMVPEGDRVTGSMVFHSQDRIYETMLDVPAQGATVQRVSDIMVWPVGTNRQWRVLSVFPYPNRNYWKAIAVRLAGN